MMKRASFFPNVITAFGLACGLFVIFKTNVISPHSSDYEIVQTAAFLLLIAGVADFIDGALARAMHAESEFGLVFDSLSDAISFGVAPSALMLKALSLEQGTFLSFFSVTGAIIFSLCGVLRLVRYSVKAKEVQKDVSQEAAHKKYFTGLPIPAAAGGAVSANLFLVSPMVVDFFSISTTDRAIALGIVMILLGYLMVCRLKFPSLKVLHFRLPSFHLIFLVVVLAIFIIYGILYFFALALAFVAWAYITTSLVLSFIRLIAGKKSKTLEEFEPDPEDVDPHS